ncbi:hypothetical protein SPRG_03798 [Saprolegnia parasitica CBS 223.65]|uniref:Deoxyribodipyrimidine photo-lyase n=1 Tax=Saprolegnia parasitica (strain CBS 223.65) TaxID=695850 RepID=A0A067CPP9_SAPPC|nr:hypothetical protein SPRG_03798 [Saprolegnia parasitica CBS 223.65]KDO31180.1 hypothetical protein SPRG_03798 [Saprolegnia parasitica CBS 223.65]|eukprot:XP_012197787.1 hypothetical protein SPRG_03798 [Saprolegnia parasitica CBS 223.65]
MKLVDLAVAGVKAERLRWLHGSAALASGSHVLYWMQTSLRTRYNYALHVAMAAATALQKPLYVLYTLDTREAGMSERHMAFLLESLYDVNKSLAQTHHIPFSAVHCSSGSDGPLDLVLAASRNASLVVTELQYLRAGRKLCTSFGEQVTAPVVQVESDVVVPVEVASNKEEYAARTLRPKITKHLPTYITPLPSIAYTPPSSAPKSLQELQAISLSRHDAWLDLTDASAVDTLLAAAKDVDRSIPRLLSKKLLKYGTERNEPSGNGASNLSPYLHYGNISPVDIALQVNATEGRGPAMAASKASFLEELIVRRELSMNFVWFNPRHYDSIKSLPPFATETLAIHADDARAIIYTEAQLDKAMTHDAYWNAAQLDMIVNGKMQNYMRMYWGKKILEWTASPDEAYEICMRLNDKYNLDGSDPNSYTGIAWVFGKHDTGWAERAIFGKVRYMNADGLKRKYDMQAYVNMIRRQCTAAKMTLQPKQLALEYTKPRAKRQKKFSLMQALSVAHVLVSVYCSVWFVDLVTPSLQNDLFWPQFAASTAQTYLLDVYRRHLTTTLANDALSFDLLDAREGIVKVYGAPTTVGLIQSTYARSLALGAYASVEDAVVGFRSLDPSYTFSLMTLYCWADFDRRWALAHTAARQARCTAFLHANGAVYLESVLRNVAWAPWTALYGASFDAAVGDAISGAAGGEAWLASLAHAFTSIDDEVAFWKSKRIVTYELQWSNMDVFGIHESIGVVNMLGWTQALTTISISYAPKSSMWTSFALN